MYNKTITKYLSNPIIGLFPYFAYILMHAFRIEEWCTIVIALLISIVSELTIRKVFKSKAFSLAYYILDIAFIITLLFYFFSPNAQKYGQSVYIVFTEVSIVTFYIFLGIGRTFVKARWLRNKSVMQKALLERFYSSSSAIQYIFTLHLFLILLCKYLKNPNENYDILNFGLFTLIPCISIIGLFLYEMANMNNIWAKLRNEEWLPIITPKGEVTGKIAKSVSLKVKNKFMHPVVRVALICKGKIFLQERAKDNILDANKLDHPFEKYILFKHDLNIAARNSIAQLLNYEEKFPLSFILKYEFENDNTKRLNIVYVSEIDDETIIKRDDKVSGKFWTMKQVESGFSDGIYSECFELEYEYLKNKVLLDWNKKKESISVNDSILSTIKDSSADSISGRN